MAELSSLMAMALARCEQRGARMTAHRQHIYRLIIESQNAISAYDLLAQLRLTEPQAQPPTVYRALDFLLQQALIHKVESTSCYIACCQLEQKNHCSQLLICTQCGMVTESNNAELFALLQEKSQQYGFNASHHIIESHGICQACGQNAN